MTTQKLNSVEIRLNAAFVKSGMTPEQFYEYIVRTREVENTDPENLSFKIGVPEYEYDLEWYTFHRKVGLWLEG